MRAVKLILATAVGTAVALACITTFGLWMAAEMARRSEMDW